MKVIFSTEIYCFLSLFANVRFFFDRELCSSPVGKFINCNVTLSSVSIKFYLQNTTRRRDRRSTTSVENIL